LEQAMNKIVIGAVLGTALCGGAVAAFGSRPPAQEVARESLDLLKAMSMRSSHAYVASCVTAIAAAKRHELRKDANTASVRETWTHAAGQCRGLATTVCDVWALEAPRDACSRIRAYPSVL
jgi:hypothetical protein